MKEGIKNFPFEWDVESKPIKDHNGKIIKSHKNLVRSDNQESIFLMGAKYEPLTNRELWRFAQRVSLATGCPVTGHSEFKDGRVVMVQLENTKKDFEIAGHKMKSNIIIGNSFDGTRPIFIGCSDTLIRCSNQFGRILQTMKIRHSRQHEDKLDELVMKIEDYFKEYDKLLKTFNNFSKVKIDAKIRKMFVDTVLDVDSTVPYFDLSTRKKNLISQLDD